MYQNLEIKDYLKKSILVFSLYFIFSKIGLLMTTYGNVVSPVWPAAGAGFLLIYHYGIKYWLGIFVAAIVSNMLHGSTLLTSFFIGIGNVAEALITYTLYISFRRRTEYWEMYGKIFSIILASLIGSIFASLNGAGTLFFFSIIPSEEFIMTTLTWGLGDFLGIIFFAPLIMELEKQNWLMDLKKTYGLSIVLYILTLILGYLVFYKIQFAVFVFTLFLSLYIIQYWTNFITLAVATTSLYVLALLATYQQNSSFNLDEKTIGLFGIQILFSSFFLSAMFFSVLAKKSLNRVVSVVLVIGWIVSSVLLQQYFYSKKIEQNKDFSEKTKMITDSFKEKLNIYEVILKASAGFVESSDEVSGEEWFKYTSKLTLPEDFPGINGLGIIYKFPLSQISQFEFSKSKHSLYPFKIHPVPGHEISESGDEASVITLIEPYEKNKPAHGLLISSESKRKQASDISADSNTPQITDIIQLVQDNKRGPGFLYYYPFYSKSKMHQGWSYAPFIGEKLFDITEYSKAENLDLRVSYLGQNKTMQELKPFLFSNEESFFDSENKIKFANTEFILSWVGRRNNYIPLNTSSGLIISSLALFTLLLASLIAGFIQVTEKAQAIADEYKKELDVNQMKLIGYSKMSALGEMASGIAHEINNPLSVIGGRADAIKKLVDQNEFDKDKVNYYLDHIQKTILRITKIINGLRSFARTGEREPFKSVNIIDAINGTLELCQSRFKSHGVELNFECSETNIFVIGNETQLAQVFLNLLNNSYDAVHTSDTPWVRIALKKDGLKVIVSVSDSGPGIPEEISEKLMQPFFTTKEVGKGTGLGLSISKGIIEEHKGSLVLDKKAKNTCFIIELPLEIRKI